MPRGVRQRGVVSRGLRLVPAPKGRGVSRVRAKEVRPMGGFQAVEAKVSFPELELRILRFWREGDVFHESLRRRQGSPEWIFYEGPPTANGHPGIHHTESRTFKDIYPRFKTMTGHFVPRKAGWDCHGLPVELEVEKEIATRSKRDIAP